MITLYALTENIYKGHFLWDTFKIYIPTYVGFYVTSYYKG